MTPHQEAECVFENFVRCITGMMRVVGVTEVVRLLRQSADKLEANKGLLDMAARGSSDGRPIGRA